MKASEVLRKAKKKLWNGRGEWLRSPKTRYICYAVDEVSCHDSACAVERVLIHISKLLNHYGTLEKWLYVYHHISSQSTRKMQRTRQLWVDDMIKYFESKGD